MSNIQKKVGDLLKAIDCEPEKWHVFRLVFYKTLNGDVYIDKEFQLIRIQPFKTEEILMRLCPLHYEKWCNR